MMKFEIQKTRKHAYNWHNKKYNVKYNTWRMNNTKVENEQNKMKKYKEE